MKWEPDCQVVPECACYPVVMIGIHKLIHFCPRAIELRTSFEMIFSWRRFYARRSRMRKKRQPSQHCHFTLLGSRSVKVERRTLMKLNPEIDINNILWQAFFTIFYCNKILKPTVNLINILLAHFSYESKFQSFYLIMFVFVIFGAKILYEKHTHKPLMKLTPYCQHIKYFRIKISARKILVNWHLEYISSTFYIQPWCIQVYLFN